MGWVQVAIGKVIHLFYLSEIYYVLLPLVEPSVAVMIASVISLAVRVVTWHYFIWAGPYKRVCIVRLAENVI